jgi:hypothetical protein
LDGDQSGFSHWDFASTNPKELYCLAQAFGLEYEEQDNQITHSMSIVLVAPDRDSGQVLVHRLDVRTADGKPAAS